MSQLAQTYRVFVMVAGRWRRLGAFHSQDAALAALVPKPAGAVAWLIKRPGE